MALPALSCISLNAFAVPFSSPPLRPPVSKPLSPTPDRHPPDFIILSASICYHWFVSEPGLDGQHGQMGGVESSGAGALGALAGSMRRRRPALNALPA